MATEQSFVEHIQNQSGLGSALSFKKMFGEYAFYLQGKVVALACDNQLYVRPTAEGRSVLGRVIEQAPFPRAKPHFLLDEQTEDRELLRRVLIATADAMPLPKPKLAKAKKMAKGAPKRAAKRTGSE